MFRNLTFQLGVSTTRYEKKCTEWGKLRYQTVQLDIDGLEDYIRKGYCFTHTFKDVSADGSFGCQEKTIKNFKSTNTVFLDIDDCSLTAQEFYASVTPQPTIIYTTPSNITGEKNRFRLVYLYEQPILSNDTYKKEVQKISTGIGKIISDFSFDSTSTNASQQMGGNGTQDCLLLKSYNIFNFNTFKEYEECSSTTYKKEERNDISNRKAVDCKEKEIVIIDKEFIKDFWEMNDSQSVYNLLNKYSCKYPLFDATQVHEDKPYIYLNNYVEISRRYYVVKDENNVNRAIPVKIKEGNREKILFNNALLRLKINPEMSFENLLYAMVYERTYWIDNSDGEFTNKTLYKIAKGAFTKRELYDIRNATEGQKKRRARTNKNGFKVNKAYCEKYNISIRTMANKMRRDISNATILENYDFKKSVEENSKLLKENDITPNSERRLYEFMKWCKEEGIIIDNKKDKENEEV
jgi:hypothetical protein